MKEKREELKFNVNRLKTGLDKLIDANVQVALMQEQLKKLQPELAAAAIETEQMMIKIDADKKEADAT